jgi:phosphocarrier protein FPr
MVGLVIVSHSNALSRVLADLVRQVTAKGIPLAAVGGVGTDRESFGTDAVDIADAVASVYSADGVAVLMDLGSAVLSAETALELLPDDQRSRVRLCAAPIVEGAVAAGVQISLGSDLEMVCREATQALGPKIRHLGEPVGAQGEVASVAPERGVHLPPQKIVLTVNSPHGLHARPAARFVQTASAFDARVRVKKVGTTQAPVPAASLNRLATLDVRCGDRIVVTADGTEAEKALNALADLVNLELKDPVEAPLPAPPPPADFGGRGEGFNGIAASEGIAIGPAYRYRPRAVKVARKSGAAPEREWAALLQARDKACEDIRRRRRAVEYGADASHATIFDAHLLMLQDPALLDPVRARIFERGDSAAWAWQQAVAALAADYRALSDDYLRQRADDVADIGRQVLLNLQGHKAAKIPELPQPAILVARDLTPADVAELNPERVLGIVTLAGGPTSHSAILARSLGIPSVAGIDPDLLDVAPDTTLGLDGFSGTLWIRPSAKICARLEAARTRWLQERRRLRFLSRQPAVTQEGRQVAVAANLGSLPEADKAHECGADGVGLLRTEFLFLNRRRPPDEAEQVDMLVRIAEAVDGKPVCVRTLDVGGDKPLPYLSLPTEANPYLGLRAVRLCLRHPEIFRPQLRAVLRAGIAGDVRLMFPMISRVEEVDRLVAIRDEVHRELARENLAHRWPMPTGIMVETPAAALLMSSFAERLDFFSIGTNDLTQYALAAERGNENLKDYADPLHPVVLRLIGQVVSEAHRCGKPVAVCGETAADAVAVPVLIGLGVDELSMAPEAIPRIKSAVRALASKEAAGLAERVCATDTADRARSLAGDFFKSKFDKGTVDGD